jgi:serine O-acetyltransferase
VYNVNASISTIVDDIIINLQEQIEQALFYTDEFHAKSGEEIRKESERIVMEFMHRIPSVREYLDTDLQATLDGDPAAYSKSEIILCYPGFYAITVFRLAHELYLLRVPMIPRIMTEHAHSKTGVDLHPGATVGKYFMIDHATGIVVGETTVKGEHVKVYQGDTIGALSTTGGQKLQVKKRHPTLEDNVTYYARWTDTGCTTWTDAKGVAWSYRIIDGNAEIYRDGLWANISAVTYAYRGGASASGARVGAWFLGLLDAASGADWNFGAAPSCKPQSPEAAMASRIKKLEQAVAELVAGA